MRDMLYFFRKYRTVLTGCAAALLCESFFGFSFFFTKTSVGSYHVLDLLGWRFLIASIAMNLCVLAGIVKIRVAGKKLLPLFGMGMLFPGLYYIFEACALKLTTASEVGVLVASVPAVTLLLSALILKEIPDWHQIAGIALAIAGVVICTVAKGVDFSFSIAGYCLTFCGIFCFSIFSICSRKAADYSSWTKTYFLLWDGVIVYVSAALIRRAIAGNVADFLLIPFRDAPFLLAASYLGICCSVISLFLCNLAISCIGPARSAAFIGFETLVAIGAGVLLLHESFTPFQTLGSIMVIAGVTLANVPRKNSGTGR